MGQGGFMSFGQSRRFGRHHRTECRNSAKWYWL